MMVEYYYVTLFSVLSGFLTFFTVVAYLVKFIHQVLKYEKEVKERVGQSNITSQEFLLLEKLEPKSEYYIWQ